MEGKVGGGSSIGRGEREGDGERSGEVVDGVVGDERVESDLPTTNERDPNRISILPFEKKMMERKRKGRRERTWLISVCRLSNLHNCLARYPALLINALFNLSTSSTVPPAGPNSPVLPNSSSSSSSSSNPSPSLPPPLPLGLALMSNGGATPPLSLSLMASAEEEEEWWEMEVEEEEEGETSPNISEKREATPPSISRSRGRTPRTEVILSVRRVRSWWKDETACSIVIVGWWELRAESARARVWASRIWEGGLVVEEGVWVWERGTAKDGPGPSLWLEGEGDEVEEVRGRRAEGEE
jgi:hypothetical protein